MAINGIEYYSAESFLLGFNPNVYYDPEREIIPEDELVQMALDVFDVNAKERIARTIAQVNEILAMEPFPWEWVYDMVCGAVPDEEETWTSKPEKIKLWLANLIHKFEAEAKRQGKL